MLQTKWTQKGLRKSDRLPEFLKAFNGAAKPVGSSLVDDGIRPDTGGYRTCRATQCIVKLDIHLARAEFQAAFHLTESLKNLQLSDYDIAEVLARQVIASCGLKDLEKAKAVYAQLSNDYPYNPATEMAKQAIIQAIGRQ